MLILFYDNSLKMTLNMSKTKVFLLFAFVLSILIFSRFYNLDKTARFIWDESSDLVSMRQIYLDKKLTIIGPISEDGNKVFGSLSYYMLLPFAILGNFDPLSTAIGAAFWGVVTSILLIYLTYKINKKVLIFSVPIALFWYPLVQTGRWAWNPNFIPLFVITSLIFFLKKGSRYKFISGLLIGLSIYLHYVAIFAVIGLGIVELINNLKKRNVKEFIAYSIGVVVAILPFVLFDITHPPGLFLSRILYFNYLGTPTQNLSFAANFFIVINQTFQYFTQISFLKILLLISFTLLAIKDLKTRSKALFLIGIFLIQAVGVSFISDFYTHYMLPGVIFFLIYVIYPRKGLEKYLSYVCLFIIVVSSILSFPKQITKVTWESNIFATRYIANTINEKITTNQMKNVNLAVLSSPDTNTYGRRYRDLLLLKDVNLKTKGEYEISDSLFVITTSSLESVRSDPAYEIKNFKNGPLVNSWEVPESPWKIFLLSKPI